MPDPCMTLERVISFGPCHSAEKIQAWYPGRKRVRLSTVLRDDRITRADRLWLATRVLPKPVVQRWLEVVVERAIRRSLGTSGCPAWESWAAAWLDGTDRAADAAQAAALAAWARAARAAAEAAVAARAAALADAAWAAVAAEAAEAAWAAEAEEQERQIRDLLEIICKNQGEKNA